MKICKLGFCAGLCAVLLALPAHAEKADRSKPVNLEADTVTLDDIKKVSVYQGNVILSQGTLTLHADRVQVTQKSMAVKSLSMAFPSASNSIAPTASSN